MIAEDKINEIREAARISEFISSHVELRRAGRSLKGLCPFHEEKTPSFSVNDDGGFYHCFGCGEGGNVFKFIMALEGLSFPEAVRKVADRCGIELPEERGSAGGPVRKDLFALLDSVAGYYRRVLLETPAGESWLEYLAARGINEKSSDSFMLGAAPDSGDGLLRWLKQQGADLEQAQLLGLVTRRQGRTVDSFRSRLMFPLRDNQGRVVGFAGRKGETAEGPKYINSVESSVYHKGRVLYGLDLARTAVRDKGFALLVEGYTDVIALHQVGMENVVATCGTALTAEQVKLLKRFSSEMITLFDGDEAGSRAAGRSFPVFMEAGVWARGLSLPADADPDSFVRERGVEALAELLGGAGPLVDTWLRQITGQAADTASMARVASDLSSLLKKVQDPFEYDLLLRKASVWTGISEKVLRGQAAPTPQKRAARGAESLGGAAGLDELLVTLLLSDPSLAASVAEAGALDRMENGPFRQVASDLLQASSRADAADQLAALPSDLGARVAQRLNEGVYSDTNVARQALGDCLSGLERRQRKAINRQRLLELKRAEESGSDIAAISGMGDWKSSRMSDGE